MTDKTVQAMPELPVSQQLLNLTEAQAQDDGLWFVAKTAPEAYLQQELRKLHAAIEAAFQPVDRPLCKVSDAPTYAESLRNWVVDKNTEVDQLKAELEAARAAKVFYPSIQPKRGQHVLCMTDDADGDPSWVMATYNDEKIGYLGIGGRRVKPVFGWAELPPLERPTLSNTKEQSK